MGVPCYFVRRLVEKATYSHFHRQTHNEDLWQCWRSSLLNGTFSYVTARICLAWQGIMSEQFNQICWGAPPLEKRISLLGILKKSGGVRFHSKIKYLMLMARPLQLCILGNFSWVFVVCWVFQKLSFFKKNLFIRTTNSLDSDQAWQYVGHDIGTNCLLWLSDATAW